MRLTRKPAAIHGDDRAIDVIGCRRRQEDRRSAQVGRDAPLAGRNPVQNGLGTVLVRPQLRGVVGRHVARRDGVDIDALGTPFMFSKSPILYWFVWALLSV